MQKILVKIGFTSTDRNTRGKKYYTGQVLSGELFSDEYEKTLHHNNYIEIIDSQINPKAYEYLTIVDRSTPDSGEVQAMLNKEDTITVEGLLEEDAKFPEVIESPTILEEPIDTEREELTQKLHAEMIHMEEPIQKLHAETIYMKEPEETRISAVPPKKFSYSDLEERLIGPILITLVAVFGAFASGYMTVMGYSSLFSNSGYVVMIIIVVLEMAKFSIASLVLHQRGISVTNKVILGTFAFVLVIMAAIGHYGFLSKIYGSSSHVVSKNVDIHANIDEQLKELREDKKLLKEQIDSVPNDYVTAKRRIYKTVMPKINEIDEKISSLNAEKQSVISDTATADFADHNSMAESAKLLGTNPDEFAHYVIALFSIIVDPLVILLAFTASVMRRRRHHN